MRILRPTLAFTFILVFNQVSSAQVLTGDGLSGESTVSTNEARPSVSDLDLDESRDDPFESMGRDDLDQFVGGDRGVAPLDLKNNTSAEDFSDSAENSRGSLGDTEIEEGYPIPDYGDSNESSGSTVTLFFGVGGILVGFLGLSIWLAENRKRFSYRRGGARRSHRQRTRRDGDSPY
jgi:hypothetical protein